MDQQDIFQVPTCKLSTGLVVANFNSPHGFNFTDGSILGACSPERAKAFPLEELQETVVQRDNWTGIIFKYRLTPGLREEICRVAQSVTADLIITPSAILRAIRTDTALTNRVDYVGDVIRWRFVGVKNADRITKAIHHDIFVVG